MKIIDTIAELNSLNYSLVATIGNFDGVHLGHQHLIEQIKTKKSDSQRILILTFTPHPEFIISGVIHHVITPLKLKYKKLKECGVDYIFEIKFTDKLRNMPPDQFFSEYIISIKNLEVFFLGEDFSLGKNRCFGHKNAVLSLASKNIKHEILHKISQDSKCISSTLIRQKIFEAEFDVVEKYLGHRFSFTSEVIKGKQVGRVLNYKTANLKVDLQQIYPANGVYAVRVKYKKQKYSGAMNVGLNPSVSTSENLKIEIHLLGFSGEIYGEVLEVMPVQKIRNEVKFDNLDDLKKQIANDIEKVKSIL